MFGVPPLGGRVATAVGRVNAELQMKLRAPTLRHRVEQPRICHRLRVVSFPTLRPRSRSWPGPPCWICTGHHFKLRHHPIVLVLQHMAMQHVHPEVVGEL